MENLEGWGGGQEMAREIVKVYPLLLLLLLSFALSNGLFESGPLLKVAPLSPPPPPPLPSISATVTIGLHVHEMLLKCKLTLINTDGATATCTIMSFRTYSSLWAKSTSHRETGCSSQDLVVKKCLSCAACPHYEQYTCIIIISFYADPFLGENHTITWYVYQKLFCRLWYVHQKLFYTQLALIA